MPHHTSFRDHLLERAEQGQQVEFQPSRDQTLLDFADLFAAADSCYALDANKHRGEEGYEAGFELTVELYRTADAEPEQFFTLWSPVAAGEDPQTGFRAGPDSSFYGHSAAQVVPQDIRGDVLVLLVTSDFTHLSGSRESDPPQIRGARNAPGATFEYVELVED